MLFDNLYVNFELGEEMKHTTIKIKTCGMPGHRVRQRGASLLEGIAYLGIAALVILGAVSLLASAFGNAQANRATEEVISLRTAVRKLYSGQAYPVGTAVRDTLFAAGAIPGTLNRNPVDRTIANSWGGAVTIIGAGATFNVAYANVPQDVCVNMLSGASGWNLVAGNGANTDVMPVTAARATDICTQPNNNITFTAG